MGRWKRPPRKLVIDGVARTISEWAVISGQHPEAIRSRKKMRWTTRDAVWGRPGKYRSPSRLARARLAKWWRRRRTARRKTPVLMHKPCETKVRRREKKVLWYLAHHREASTTAIVMGVGVHERWDAERRLTHRALFRLYAQGRVVRRVGKYGSWIWGLSDGRTTMDTR